MVRFLTIVAFQLMLFLLGVLVLGIAFPANAQTARNCAPRQMVLERLADRYGETRQSIGLAASGAVVEVFASPETGTWTIAVTTVSGLTCLLASGRNFERLNEPPRTKDDDT